VSYTRDQAVDLALLALAVWREARGEPVDAKNAVSWVVMNRVKANGWFGKGVVGVLTHPWQFSSLTAPGDPNLIRWPNPVDTASDMVWSECLDAAEGAYNGTSVDTTGGAVNYYSVDIAPPSWTMEMTYVGQIGNFKFYKR
jgi:spore germination cell wall hydrolase CwlJ-like protein